MTVYKKIVSIALSLIFIFSVFGAIINITTVAGTTPVLSAEKKNVNPGQQFDVAISLSNASEICGGNFTLEYDNSSLTVDSFAFGTIVSECTKNCNLDYQSSGNLIRVTFSGVSELSSDGILITISFTAKENKTGSAAMKFSAYKMYDENGNSVPLTANNSYITITSEKVSVAEISVDDATVVCGEIVNVPVSISGSDNIYGGNFTLEYDNKLLEIDSYSFDNKLDGYTKNCNTDYQSAGNLIRVTFSGTSEIDSDGVLIMFSFKAKETGEAELNFSGCKMYDGNGVAVEVETVAGNISITDNSETTTRPESTTKPELTTKPDVPDYILGDVNGDGKITAADARLALRLSAGLETLEKLNVTLEIVDYTGDKKITAADARMILRKAAGLE